MARKREPSLAELVGEPVPPAPPNPEVNGHPGDHIYEEGRAEEQSEIEGMDLPEPMPWPTIPEEAFHGIAGEVVRALMPHTEADPVAILAQLLVGAGNLIGRAPYFPHEGDFHHANLFTVIVGKSSHGRKGTSWGRSRQILKLVSPVWAAECIRGGLASGEGLVYHVRDAVKRKGAGDTLEIVDEGVDDKRLLAVETEFGQVLRVIKRDSNTLSSYMREAWDSGDMASLTKNSPLKATGAHVSIIGHITWAELLRYLDEVDVFNGFANRFLWLMVRRSKFLPSGGGPIDLNPFAQQLASAVSLVSSREHPDSKLMERDAPAERLWNSVYRGLARDQPGFFGATTSRAVPQVVRLSMLYALLDGSLIIGEDHLLAALGLWSYAEASARMIFGEATQVKDDLETKIVGFLRDARAAGLSRTQIHKALSKNIPAKKILGILGKLEARGEARRERFHKGGPVKPTERWYLVSADEINEVTKSESQTNEGE